MFDNPGLERQREARYMPIQDEDPKAFLLRRREEMVRREKELDDELALLRMRLRSLDAAIDALGGSAPRPADKPRLTIKEGVLKVLERVDPEGLTALSILERLKVDLDLDYPRTSLSPQLSRLKTDGKIKLRNGIWYLQK